MTPRAAGGDLLDGVPDLIEHLRAYAYRLSLEDELRLLTLRDEVRARGDPPGTVAALGEMVAPLVCRNPDEQEQLGEVLARWRAPVVLAAQERAAAAEASEAPPATPRSRRRVVWLLVGLLLAAGLFALWWNLRGGDVPQPAPTAPPPAPEAEAAPAAAVVADAPLAIQAVLALLPFLLALFACLRRRQTPAFERGMAPRAAASDALAIATSDSPAFRPGAIQGALRDLRRHRLAPSDDIDVQRSVTATAAAAGYPRLIRQHRFVLPDYLLLNDRASSRDHFGDLAEVLVGRLAAEQFQVTRGEYYGDPRSVSLVLPDGRSEPADLAELAHDRPDARLMVLADVASFWDPIRRRWRDWVDDLAAFDSTAIMTPLPQTAWGERERALIARGFLLVPATAEGLGQLAERFRATTILDPPRTSAAQIDPLELLLATDPYRWIGDALPPAPLIAELVAGLRASLSEGAFLHLCAVAVFPQLNPRLTEQVGAAVTLADGTPAMTEQGLMALARLPWLRQGRMPDWLRKALIEAMGDADAVRVRAVWTALLAPAATGAAAALKLDFDRSPGELDRLRRRLVALIRGGVAPDLSERLLLAFLEGRALPDLAVAAPDQLAAPSRPPDRRDAAILLAGAVASAMLLANGAALLAEIASVSAGLAGLLRLTTAVVLVDLVVLFAWAIDRASGRRSLVGCTLAVLALPAALLADGEDIQSAIFTAASVGALYAFSRPGLRDDLMRGLDISRLFAGDRWWLTSLVLLVTSTIVASGLSIAISAGGATPAIDIAGPAGQWGLGCFIGFLGIVGAAAFMGHRTHRPPLVAPISAVAFVGIASLAFVHFAIARAIGLIPTDVAPGDIDLLVMEIVLWLPPIIGLRVLYRAVAGTGPPLWLMSAVIGCWLLKVLSMAVGAASSASIDAAVTLIVLSIVTIPLPAVAVLLALRGRLPMRGVAARIAAVVSASFAALILAFVLQGVVSLALSENMVAATLLWAIPVTLSWPLLRLLVPTLWIEAPAAMPTVHHLPMLFALTAGCVSVEIGNYGLALSPLLLPASLWLIDRYGWFGARRMLAVGCAPLLLNCATEFFASGESFRIATDADVGLYVLLLLLPRLIGDRAYRARCLAAERLSWRDGGLLLLVMGTVIHFSWSIGGSTIGVSWQMFAVQNALLMMIGLSRIRLAPLFAVLGAAVLLTVPVMIFTGEWKILGSAGWSLGLIGPLALVPQIACNALILGASRLFLRDTLPASAGDTTRPGLIKANRPTRFNAVLSGFSSSLFIWALGATLIFVRVGGGPTGVGSFPLLSDLALYPMALIAAVRLGRRAGLPMLGGILGGVLLNLIVADAFPRVVLVDTVAVQLTISLGVEQLLERLPAWLSAMLLFEIIVRQSARERPDATPGLRQPAATLED